MSTSWTKIDADDSAWVMSLSQANSRFDMAVFDYSRFGATQWSKQLVSNDNWNRI